MARWVAPDNSVRIVYREHIARMVEHLGHLPGSPWQRELEAIDAGDPIIVAGWEIDMARDPGRFCLEADGTVTRVDLVPDPTKARPGRVNYLRPDGTLVRSRRRRSTAGSDGSAGLGR